MGVIVVYPISALFKQNLIIYTVKYVVILRKNSDFPSQFIEQ